MMDSLYDSSYFDDDSLSDEISDEKVEDLIINRYLDEYGHIYSRKRRRVVVPVDYTNCSWYKLINDPSICVSQSVAGKTFR
jgi:hypothetical protein